MGFFDWIDDNLVVPYLRWRGYVELRRASPVGLRLVRTMTRMADEIEAGLTEPRK